MCSYNRLLVVWLLFTFLCIVSGSTDDWSDCPSFCRCKWQSGKKQAECSKRNLTAVPSSLHPDIQSLDLSSNTLSALPANAFQRVGLVNLHKIDLKECQIKELDKDAFKGLSILIELNLSANNIHSIHPDTFIETSRLRVLHLNGNPIQSLENGLFRNLTHLAAIDLSNCRISRIGHKTFDGLPNMRTLKLSGNQLTQIHLSSIKSMSGLSSLELGNNPWNCDCHLRDLRNWTISRGLYNPTLLCAEPSSLRGLSWDMMDSETVKCPPKILQTPPGRIIEPSSVSVTLSCKVPGNPPSSVDWIYKPLVTDNNTPIPYYEVKSSNPDGRKDELWHNLTISNIRSDLKGEYTCAIKSQDGIEERNVNVDIRTTGTVYPSKSSSKPHDSSLQEAVL